MKRHDFVLAAYVAAIITLSPAAAYSQQRDDAFREDFKKAVSLYEKGLFDRSRAILEKIPDGQEDMMVQGYTVLNAASMQAEGYEILIMDYLERFSYSPLINQIHFQYALNLFDKADFKGAVYQFACVSESGLYADQRPEFLFKRAYSDYETGNSERATKRFTELEKLNHADYTAPSRYALANIAYEKGEFRTAQKWFELSAKDARFKDLSNYYLVECLFMQKDYAYAVEHGSKIIEKCPKDRKERLARILSESYLVLGNTAEAEKYYRIVEQEGPRTRSDFFYAGSLMYALQNYQEAISNFRKMGDRSDSLGQIANYQMAYSSIKVKNKVDALDAFRDASAAPYDAIIAEDAFFNCAKLSYDLNNDASVFKSYLENYPNTDKKELIYSYIAVASLRNRDYAAAIAAYDMIDELDDNMTLNYMKANYLRAGQLIEGKSWRRAVPHLKTASYFSEKRSGFNQLTRYWLAEALYNSGEYAQARAGFTELYNVSALYGLPEADMLPYNIAFCYFKEGNFSSAIQWFRDYAANGKKPDLCRDAMTRVGDCYFIKGDYKNAANEYKAVVDAGAPDLYACYQAGLSYGLAGKDAEKVAMLEKARSSAPASKYYPESMYELGRAYVKTGNTSKAVETYNILTSKVKDAEYTPKALLELGLIAQNASDSKKAIAYYKQVVAQYPNGEYAGDALTALEAIYQNAGDPEEYLTYLASIGKSNLKTADEKEQMIFNAAEQTFVRGDWQKALSALEAYNRKYPQGKMQANSYFYIAESYRQLGDKERACDYYRKVIDMSTGSYAEIAMLNLARLSFSLEDFEEAYSSYSMLAEKALIDNNKYEAVVGMMNSAYAAKMYSRAIEHASAVIADARADKADKRRAEYVSAKSLLASSDRAAAFKLLKSLAEDKSDEYGAEAAYMVITDAYDRGEFTEVENLVFAFSDAGSPQTYYLAKSFIVLGDSYVERLEYKQAKATFESIRDGYKPSSKDDDVLENVTVRLEKLAQITPVVNQ